MFDKDEIIEMARQAGLGTPMEWHGRTYIEHGNALLSNELEAFAKLVAAKEREACANVAKQISDKYAYGYYGNEVDTADEIEKTIRARGEA